MGGTALHPGRSASFTADRLAYFAQSGRQDCARGVTAIRIGLPDFASE